MQKIGFERGGGGKFILFCKYTPLYEKGIKKTENKSMETTVLNKTYSKQDLRTAVKVFR